MVSPELHYVLLKFGVNPSMFLGYEVKTDYVGMIHMIQMIRILEQIMKTYVAFWSSCKGYQPHLIPCCQVELSSHKCRDIQTDIPT